jgi:hypothetical protein
LEPSSRRPQFGDREYHFAAFRRDMIGGGLRWLATVFTVLSATSVVCVFSGVLPPDLYWPIHATGGAAKLIVVGALVVWSVVAVLNWRAHLRRDRGGPAAG